jgi:phosphoglycerol transferase
VEAIPYIAIAVAAPIGWMYTTGRWTLADLSVPLVYTGDALGVLAQIKAYMSGDLIPFLAKEIHTLGAPFGAGWTDYPAEDLIYFAASLLARVFGLFAGSTVFLILLDVLAGWAFYAAGTALGYRRSVVAGMAVLFALAQYGFVRNLYHLTLTAYFHIPLLLFAVRWAASRVDGDSAPSSRWQAGLAVAGAILAGFLNPYYLAVFLWLMGFVFVGAFIAGRKREWISAGLLWLVAAGAFALQMLDTVWLDIVHGPNYDAVQRHLIELDMYSLRLPDLLVPWVHRSPAMMWLNERYFHGVASGRGEAMAAYIGLVGGLTLLCLLASGCIRIASRQFDRVNAWFWMALAILGLGVTGGINFLIGLLGFVFLRATNRFSIVLYAIALFWICEVLTRVNRAAAVAIMVALVAFGLWDQLPPSGLLWPMPNLIREQVESDRQFVARLEAALPRGAMVLQLPVKGFPETGAIGEMDEYEHFRPYLHSTDLRFSYGTVKGRGDADWQLGLVGLPAGDLVARARLYGFAAIYVNRKAYADNADAETRDLEQLLGEPIADSKDLVAYRVPASSSPPQLPPLLPHVAYEGFSIREVAAMGTWRWATAQQARIVVSRPYAVEHAGVETYSPCVIDFTLAAINGGDIVVSANGREAAHMRYADGSRHIVLSLPPGSNRMVIEIRSSRPSISPANGDPRQLSFRVIDFHAAFAPAGAPGAGQAIGR